MIACCSLAENPIESCADTSLSWSKFHLVRHLLNDGPAIWDTAIKLVEKARVQLNEK